MKIHNLHAWSVNPKEALNIQHALSQQVIYQDNFGEISHIAGIDVGFEAEGRITKAAVCVLHFPTLTLIEKQTTKIETSFPYIPGLLSFREIPAILEALEKVQTQVDLLMCDGQGIAHPRRFGIACHLGVLTGLPSIGIGKSKLLGSHESVPNERGAWVKLQNRDEVIGGVLRTRERIKPIYVSLGHKICLETAIRWVMATTRWYKLPEPTRLANKLASHSLI